MPNNSFPNSSFLNMMLEKASTEQNATALVKKDHFNSLLGLVEAFGTAVIKRHPKGYIITIDGHDLNVVTMVNYCSVGFLDHEPASKDDTNLLSAAANFLFDNPVLPIFLKADATQIEQLLWLELTRRDRLLQAVDSGQQQRFSHWESQLHLSIDSSRTTESELEEYAQADNSTDIIEGHNLDEAPHIDDERTVLFIASDCINPIMELIDDQELTITLEDGKLELRLGGFIIYASDFNELCKLELLNISTLGIGAASLMSKFARHLHGDNKSGISYTAEDPVFLEELWEQTALHNHTNVIDRHQKGQHARWERVFRIKDNLRHNLRTSTFQSAMNEAPDVPSASDIEPKV